MSAVPWLHVIATVETANQPHFADVVAAIAEHPRTALHFRDRSAAGRALAEAARRTGDAGAVCLINDRADVALASEAAGVHLPAAGLRVDQARRVLSAGLVGKSAHSVDEAAASFAAGADYTFLGPIWPTSSHPGASGIGLQPVQDLPGPVIGIGGVTPERIGPCLANGYHGVAVISAVWDAADPAAVIRGMQVLLDR